MYSEQYYRTLAFLAGFGAAGALGCDAVMDEEIHFPEPSTNHGVAAQSGPPFQPDTGGRSKTTVTEE